MAGFLAGWLLPRALAPVYRKLGLDWGRVPAAMTATLEQQR